METYRVRISGGAVKFATAHFVVFSATECEALHGHNYTVSAELAGPLDESGMVYDFVAVERMLREIAARIDHRTILPLRSPYLAVEDQGSRVRARFRDREWILPRGDCVLIPVPNTTAEEMAAWFAGNLLEELQRAGLPVPASIEVGVEESTGQGAFFRRG